MTMKRYLTKSRFKLAIECPAKLFYIGKRQVYADASVEDEFLLALAEGGYQVGELAKLMHPGGIEVKDRDHHNAVAETKKLLAMETVTIFEAAVSFDNLFVRVDILKKDGPKIELIEVKSKSYDPAKEDFFEGAKGGINTKILPYLQDIAFQTFVFQNAYPALSTSASSYLMMVDKSRTCSVGNLNQQFRVSRGSGGINVTVTTSHDKVGDPILTKVPVSKYINRILREPLKAPGQYGPFADVVRTLATAYVTDTQIAPVLGSHCGSCQFRKTGKNQANPLRDGRQECWARHGISAEEFEAGTVLDLWNFKQKNRLIASGCHLLKDVTEADLKIKKSDKGLSHSERQWMQVTGNFWGQDRFYFDQDIMSAELNGLEFPLHFIDFETTRVALPFTNGQRPYSNVAFQFSHHLMHSDGRVEHCSQFLNTSPGINPNYEFVRNLKKRLGNVGTVFRWSYHENTVLNAILTELENDRSPPEDVEALKAFLLSLTTKGKGGQDHQGSRAMVDLCKVAELGFFHPSTKGSSSIKKVLPAVMKESEYLREKYSKPIYGATDGIRSQNWQPNELQIWWAEVNGAVLNPYDMLPPVFPDVAASEVEAIEFSSEEDMRIQEGGAAMTAYARLQFEDLPAAVRLHIEAAMKRYCELDTLAMVMIYEAWRDWCRNSPE